MTCQRKRPGRKARLARQRRAQARDRRKIVVHRPGGGTLSTDVGLALADAWPGQMGGCKEKPPSKAAM